MRKILFAIMVVLLLNVSLVFAHEHNFAETKQIIDSGISCDKLTDEQFEAMGDYYMEQMHPGEAHEMMDQMMGGEGSDTLKQMHIQMAKRLYCNEDVGGMMGGGMMNMMIGSGGMIIMESKNTWVWILAGAALLFLFGSFGMGGYGVMGYGFIFMLLFWGVLIWLAITLINAWSVKEKDDPSTIL